jgi:hypothetical protein
MDSVKAVWLLLSYAAIACKTPLSSAFSPPDRGHIEQYPPHKVLNMSTVAFSSGEVIGLLVVGLILGIIVQSYGKKKGMSSLGTIGMGACVASSLAGAPFGLYWLLALPTMGIFLAIMSGRK